MWGKPVISRRFSGCNRAAREPAREPVRYGRRFALYCKAEGLIPHRMRNSFCGGERRPSGEEGISMYVSCADLFQFALALFVPALSENKKK